MNSKNDIINQIQDHLGSEGSEDLAEKMYEAMRADNRIFYDGDYKGLQIREDVDLLAVAEEALKN